MKKVSIAIIAALFLLAAFVVTSCTPTEAVGIASVEVRDGATALTGVDIVAGASHILTVHPLDAQGRPYTANIAEDVTFLLGRYVNGELMVGDRFAHGGWGGIRVGMNRTDALFTFTNEHPGRVTPANLAPGAYEFYIFAISGVVDMPNPPVPASYVPEALAAARTTFTVTMH
jgi:hypothetical protein